MPVVAVTGPRQSGKTTLCRSLFGDRPYVSLEALDTRQYAQQDPRGFLAEYADGVVLDEVQRAPELLSYLQGMVDEDPTPGRFILTGSQHFGLTEAITQSLAGRVTILTLLPPSLDELERFDRPVPGIWEVLWTGAYPRIHHRQLDAARWLGGYVTTYVERDVRQVLNVADLDAFATFVGLAAARTANEVQLSGLGADAGVSHNTARSWLSVLETSFLCERVPAWRRSPRKQLIKAPKLHFLDSGLVCHLLGITSPEQLRRHPLRGSIFESWVASEITKSRLHRGLPLRLFHYREAKGLEIDLLLESADELIAVEAKSGATVGSDFLRSLERFREGVASRLQGLRYRPRLIYGGDASQQRSNAEVVPWRQIQELSW